MELGHNGWCKHGVSLALTKIMTPLKNDLLFPSKVVFLMKPFSQQDWTCYMERNLKDVVFLGVNGHILRTHVQRLIVWLKLACSDFGVLSLVSLGSSPEGGSEEQTVGFKLTNYLCNIDEGSHYR